MLLLQCGLLYSPVDASKPGDKIDNKLARFLPSSNLLASVQLTPTPIDSFVRSSSYKLH
jgi:hypothetical protein